MCCGVVVECLGSGSRIEAIARELMRLFGVVSWVSWMRVEDVAYANGWRVRSFTVQTECGLCRWDFALPHFVNLPFGWRFTSQPANPEGR